MKLLNRVEDFKWVCFGIEEKDLYEMIEGVIIVIVLMREKVEDEEWSMDNVKGYCWFL